MSLCTVSDSILSNIDEVLSINPSANVFLFQDFNTHHKDWLTYSGGTDQPDELCYNFSVSNDLTQMVTFLLRSQTIILTVQLFWIYLFLLTLVFVLQRLFLHWEILIMLLIRISAFNHITYDYCCADWDGLCDHLRDVTWKDIFKLGASATAREFSEWDQVGIDVYIPQKKYQVKPHSSAWFSAACAAAIVPKSHFFHLYQKDKSSDSKV